MNKIIQPRWKEQQYTKNQIIKAGKTIRHENVSDSDYIEAVKVIDNWRAAHAFPLHGIYIHLRRMAEEHSYIVAERLKRLDSIINKLKRQPTMSLWTMQDLGGCRFIVTSIEEVYQFSETYKNSRKRHIYQEKLSKDYIKYPKVDGYRSIHEVYQYHSEKDSKYNNNFLIEIQFRTKLQHLWATAVETMGLFTKQAIKSGQGSKDVHRFFALVSSLFALEENCPIVPNTPTDVSEIVKEIKALDNTHNYLKMLQAIQVAVNVENKINKGKIRNQKGYYILVLNYEIRRLQIRYFSPSQINEANEIYAKIESSKHQSNIDAVLVRVSSFNALKTAYPNYFSDIRQFIDKIENYLS